jgi:hypothetical protein
VDCGLRIADCGIGIKPDTFSKSEIRNPKSEIPVSGFFTIFAGHNTGADLVLTA